MPRERSARVRSRSRQPDRRAHRLQPAASRCRSRSPRASPCAAEAAAAESPAAAADRAHRPRPRRARRASRSRPGAGAGAGARSCAGSSRSSPRAGVPLVGAGLEIGGDVPHGAGLSSSAALEVALCLALARRSARAGVGDAGAHRPHRARAPVLARGERLGRRPHRAARPARVALRRARHGAAASTSARSRIERGAAAARRLAARRARFRRAPRARRAPATTSGARSAPRACGCSAWSRCARPRSTRSRRLPEPLRRRARHVLEENERVREAVAALRAEDLAAVGALLNASHAACATTTRSPPLPSRRRSQRCAPPGRPGRAPHRRRLRRRRARPVRPRRRAACRAPARCSPGPGAHLLGGDGERL